MTLHPPFEISPSLKPALRIGDAWVCLELTGGFCSEGRAIYAWQLLLPDGSEHSGADLRSGVGGGTLVEGFKSLLSFLGACAESMRHWRGKDPVYFAEEIADSNASLFPRPVAEWAGSVGSDAFSLLESELSEADSDLIKA